MCHWNDQCKVPTGQQEGFSGRGQGGEGAKLDVGRVERGGLGLGRGWGWQQRLPLYPEPRTQIASADPSRPLEAIRTQHGIREPQAVSLVLQDTFWPFRFHCDVRHQGAIAFGIGLPLGNESHSIQWGLLLSRHA